MSRDDPSRRKHANARPGPRTKKLRPIPTDFREIAPSMGDREARAFWSVGHGALARWYEETGIQPFKVRYFPIPAGFVDIGPTMRLGELATHFNVHRAVVGTWLKKSGVECIARPAAPPKKPKPSPYPYKFSGPHSVKAQRDTSDDGLAAEHLRCVKRAAIYRCTSTGRADPSGYFWRYGAVVITPAEMLDRAERAGWQRWAVAA